jgi:hypothetical protein
MDTGPHVLDLLLQVFDELQLIDASMDAWGTTTAIEANCVLNILGDGKIPCRVALSRNRNLSNQAVFDFEDAEVVLRVRDNHIVVNTKQGSTYRMMPDHADHTPIAYPKFFDMFYERFLIPGDNSEVTPELSLKAIELIEQAYIGASTLPEGF